MAVDAVGGGGGFQAVPVKKASGGNQKPELAPRVDAGEGAKPQKSPPKGSVDVKV